MTDLPVYSTVEDIPKIVTERGFIQPKNHFDPEHEAGEWIGGTCVFPDKTYTVVAVSDQTLDQLKDELRFWTQMFNWGLRHVSEADAMVRAAEGALEDEESKAMLAAEEETVKERLARARLDPKVQHFRRELFIVKCYRDTVTALTDGYKEAKFAASREITKRIEEMDAESRQHSVEYTR